MNCRVPHDDVGVLREDKRLNTCKLKEARERIRNPNLKHLFLYPENGRCNLNFVGVVKERRVQS